MLDIQIYNEDSEKPKYYRNGLHLEMLIEFFRDVYLKLPEPAKVDIQVFDLFEMPRADISCNSYWEALDSLFEFYANVEKENEERIINEKINDERRD